MQFSSLHDFIAMGNHGFYVWLSFGVTFVLLFALVYSSKYKDKQTKQHIYKRQLREQKLKQAAQLQQQSSSVGESEEVIS